MLFSKSAHLEYLVIKYWYMYIIRVLAHVVRSTIIGQFSSEIYMYCVLTDAQYRVKIHY